VGRPVGLGGECVIHPASADPADVDRVAAAPVRIVPEGDNPAQHSPVAWTGLRRQGQRFVASFGGLDSREAIAKCTHWQLWVDPHDLAPLEEAETHWIDDLVGCRVIQVAEGNRAEEDLGEVVAVSEGVAQDHLEVARAGGRRASIPFLRVFLRGIDVENGIIRVDLPDGLIEG
jgi:16S rRNA processing protein RimM